MSIVVDAIKHKCCTCKGIDVVGGDVVGKDVVRGDAVRGDVVGEDVVSRDIVGGDVIGFVDKVLLLKNRKNSCCFEIEKKTD